MERRVLDPKLARVRVKRADDGDDKPPVITGYGAVFYDPNDPGTEFRIWDDMVERIMPGAFDRAIREDDVRSFFNHDENIILGRNRSAPATLALSVERNSPIACTSSGGMGCPVSALTQ